MNFMNKYEKGEFGYLKSKKRAQLIFTVSLFFISIGMYIVGYFLNEKSNANVFTIFSILLILPAAKSLVLFIVIFPYKSTKEEQYKEVLTIVTKSMYLFTDLVITSPQKVMNLTFTVIGNGNIIALAGKSGQDLKFIKEYLKKGSTNWADTYHVKIHSDYQLFLKNISNLTIDEINEKEEKDVIAHIKSLIV
jgi:NADH:ubiquinone oxidoreductase subunit K